MKTRITYLQPPSSPFTSTQASLSPSSLKITDLDAAKEVRVTIDVGEIHDEEVRELLSSLHEVHIRWAREDPYVIVAPFGSRVSAGLGVGVTPLSDGDGDGDSFTTPPILSTRFASTSTYQFHSSLPEHNLGAYITENICRGEGAACAADWDTADSIDVDFDAVSRALVVSGYWGQPVKQEGWTEEIRAPGKDRDRVEVGLLGTEKAVEAEEIKVGGLLGVVGVDRELKPTLFSFPSRHHVLPAEATFDVSFPRPTGTHPTMTISLSPPALEYPAAPDDTTCALHAYLTLPSYIFGDKYQLSTDDPLFLESHHLVALRAVSGATDLEAPDWFVPHWGSNWLLELATPPDGQVPEEWNVTVPLHLRYLRPSESGYRSAGVPWPVVFWACTAEEGTKMGTNPFDRVNLGWDGMFGPRTMFYQVHPKGDKTRHVEELDVPVLRLEEGGFFSSKTVELGTMAAIVLGLLWVLWKLGSVARSSGQKKSDKEKKSQ
ncbi:protease B nonderepressible form [Aspergillus brasiliensis]|uniref:Protein PBN1 n=1 Tax=Aspergillus brasiliensis TaxID=319629 RepID=A0A9W5YL11_9EURO|nr:protease B nonderepressible form [Aspergillus brasiliensis]GKZ41074.1 protease B nonderepressible form [Aspergillus brasiliensis]